MNQSTNAIDSLFKDIYYGDIKLVHLNNLEMFIRDIEIVEIYFSTTITYQELGERFNLSKNRIPMIIAKLKRIIRKQLYRKELKQLGQEEPKNIWLEQVIKLKQLINLDIK